MQKTVDILAKTLSIVFYPLFIPFYGMSIWCVHYARVSPYPAGEYARWLLISTAFFTCFVPLGLILLQMWLGKVKDLYITERKERNIPYLFAVFGFACWTFFMASAVPSFALWSGIGSCMALAVVYVVNHWWKISAHLTAMGGLLGAVCSFSIASSYHPFWLICTIAGVALLLMWARLRLEAHTPLQVVAGLLLGILCIFIPNYIICHV